MVTTFFPPYNFGGDGIFVHQLSNELARAGHQVDVIHCIDAYRFLTRRQPETIYENLPKVKVFGLRSQVGCLSPFLTQQTGMPLWKTRRIREILEGNTYDVIHYHNMSLIGITALSYGNGIKLYTIHEYWLVCPMHVLWKYNREVCQEKSCVRCQIAGSRPPQFWRYTGLLKKMLSKVDSFISPSRFTKRKHLELGLEVPIVHIPYFTKPDNRDTGEHKEPFPVDRPYFLFVGRLEKIKGLQDIIPVFLKHKQYDLLVAGDGEYEEILTKAAGSSSNIKFLGRLNRHKLQQLYRRAIALIVPSISLEVFGIVILEAFSMKTPVIVKNMGAMPEVIEDSGGGFVYDTEEELVAAINHLIANPSRRNELGLRGYKAYKQNWTSEVYLKRYFELIRNRAAMKIRDTELQ
jgi:glycosyltransferase involved in cell wall biosynthesis